MKRFSQQLAVAIIFLLPLYYVRFSIGPVPTNVIEVLVLILLAVTFTSEKRISLPHWQPILLILLGLIFSTSVAYDQQVALGIIKGWFLVPLAYYVCLATLFGPDERPQLVKPALASAVLVSAYAIAQWAGMIPLLAHQGEAAQQYIEQGRAIAFFESPNFLAMYLVPLTLLAGGYLYLTKQLRQLGWLMLPVIAIGLSQSRGGMLAVVAGGVWLAIRSYPVSGSRRPWWFAVVAAGLAFVLAYFRGGDDSQRFYIWNQAIIIIGQHPFLGIGPGQFQVHFINLGDGSPIFEATKAYALHPHNIFLNFYLSAGVAGLVGFVWLLVRLFRRVSALPLGLAALAGLVAVLAHGVVDSAYFKNDLAIMFWLLVFLALPKETEDHG